jgi:hypothetical protein
MNIANISTVIATLYSIIGIITPGLFIFIILLKNNKIIDSLAYKNIFIKTLTYGFLYNAFFFLLSWWGHVISKIPQLYFAELKLLMDISILCFLAISLKNKFPFLLFKLKSFFLQPANTLIFVCSIVVGVLANLSYPHTLDCGQLWVTNSLMEGKYPHLVGALGYSGLIYFPGLLFENIPLVTLAAGFKLCLSIMLGLAVISLIEEIDFFASGITKVTYYFLILFSFFGQLGLILVGKDSILGIIWLLFYFASLVNLDNQNQRSVIQSALLLSCAIASSAIIVPYVIFFTALYFILNVGKTKSHLLLLFLCLGSSIWLTFHFGEKINNHSMILVFIFIILSGLILNSVYNVINYFYLNYYPTLNLRSFSVSLLIILITSCYFLMPIKIAILGTVINQAGSVAYPPLDGKMSFYHYLFNFEPYLSKLTVFIGLSGILSYTFLSKLIKPTLSALAIFPFLTLFFTLTLAHLPNIHFLDGHELWDLSRDLMNWTGAIIFGLFALIALNSLITNSSIFLSLNFKKIIYFCCCVLLVVKTISLDTNRAQLLHLFQRATYTKTTGDKDETFAHITGILTTQKFSVNGLFISKDSKEFYMINSFPMYTLSMPIYPINFMDPNDLHLLKNKLPILLLCNKIQLEKYGTFFLKTDIKTEIVFEDPLSKEVLVRLSLVFIPKLI